jgi:hypothetical protein
MSGVNPMEFEPSSLLVDDGLEFSGWEIAALHKTNF